MIEIRIKAKAFFLLFSFLGVQIISIGCTFSNYLHDLSHNHNSSENHHKHGHEHHNDSANKTSEKEKCCVENSSIFLSGVEAIPPTNHLIIPFNSLQLISFLDDRTDSVCLFEFIVKQIRPAPLIMVYSTLFRIVIQSFQI